MGQGDSQPAHCAEVRLELPQVACPPGSTFFARLHTAAVGWSKYKAWGTAQEVGLFRDDVITVSIHMAKSEAHFDTHLCEDFAQLYLPWEVMETEMDLAGDREATFRLALARGMPRLGAQSSPSEFRDSFQQSLKLSKDSKTSCLVVGVRRLTEDEKHAAQLQAERAIAKQRQKVLEATVMESPHGTIKTPKAGASPRGAKSPATPTPQQSMLQPTTRPAKRMSSGHSTPPLANLPASSKMLPSRGASTLPASLHSNATSSSAPKGVAKAGSRLQAASPIRTGSMLSSNSAAAAGRRGTFTPPPPLTPLASPGVGGVKVFLPGRSAEIPRQRSVAESTDMPKLRPLHTTANMEVSPLKPPQQAVARASAALYGTGELTADDVQLLHQMQVHNVRLRQQLGLRDDELVPEAEEVKQVNIAGLEQAMRDNYALRESLQVVDKDLAMINVSISDLPREERLALTAGANTPAPPVGNHVVDQAEVKRQSDKVMGEIQEVTRNNLEMIKDQDEKIKALEKELSTSRRQHQQMVAQSNSQSMFSDKHSLSEQLLSYDAEHQTLQQESAGLGVAISLERQKKNGSDRTIQKLQTEHSVLLEEIEKLRQSVQRRPDTDSELMVPATAVLSLEAAGLQAQLDDAQDRGTHEQESLEQHIEDLRRMMKEYTDQLQMVLPEKELVQAELQELRSTREGGKAVEKECLELRASREAAARAAGRCHSTIRVYDEQIDELRNEINDIRRRVQDVAECRP